MLETLPVLFARTLLAQSFVLGGLFASYVFGGWLMRGEPRLARWVGVVVTGCFLATLGFHLLTSLHAFTWAPATASVALVSALSFALERRTRVGSRALRSDLRFLRLAFERWRSHKLRILFLLTIGAFSMVALRPLVAPILSWDGLTYHGLKAAIAVQTGALPRLEAPGQWSYAGPVWGGHEALSSWVMLPFHSDLLSTFVEFVQLLALALALFGLAREVRVQEPLGSFSVAVALSIPTLLSSVGSAYVELGANMMLSSALLLLVRALRARRPGSVLLAAAALGVCTGMKMNMLALTAPLSLGVAVAALRLPSSPARRCSILALCMALFFASVLPWLVYSTQLAGAPLSPLPVDVLGVELGIAPPELVQYMQRPFLNASFERELARLQALFGKPQLLDYRLGSFSVVLAFLGLVGVARLSKRHAPLGVLSVLVASGAVLSYFAPSMLVLRQYWGLSTGRFLLPGFLALAPLMARAVRARSYFGSILLFLFAGVSTLHNVAVAGIGLGAASLEGMKWAACGLVLLALAWWLSSRFKRALAPVMVLSTSCALFGLHHLRADLRYRLLETEYQIHLRENYWAEAARLCDDPEVPERIAVTSGPHQNLDNIFAFPFLGRVLQNEVTYVTPNADGRIHHFGSRTENASFAASLDREAWLSRLEAEGVTRVMSFLPRSVELTWMEARGARFRKLEGGRDWGLFEVLPPPTEAARAQSTLP